MGCLDEKNGGLLRGGRALAVWPLDLEQVLGTGFPHSAFQAA